MKHVLHFLDSLEISGGVQAVVMNTYRLLDRSKVQFDFAVYDCPETNSYRNEIEHLGGKIHVIGALSQIGLRTYIRRIKALLHSCHYDVVHAHNLHHNGIILWQAYRVGVPIRISHSHQAADERNVSLVRRCMVFCFKRLLYHYATQLVACSDKAASFLYGTRDYIFLPNAVSAKPYFQDYDLDALRKSLGIPAEAKILLHVGRFCPPKNHYFDLSLMEALPKNKSYVLLLAGGGECEEALRRMTSEHHLEECIRFIGIRSDVPALLQLADVTILPSISEGLPMVAIEAQAAGCPCLVSDVVTRQADMGLGLVCFLPLDISTWCKAIQDACTSTPQRLSKDTILSKLQVTGFESTSNLQRWYALYGIGERSE